MTTTTETGTGFRPTNVHVRARTRAGSAYRAARRRHAGALGEALAAGFSSAPAGDLRFFGGRTIASLAYASFYLGGETVWNPQDVSSIDGALGAAMTDPWLNNVLVQYYGGKVTTAPKPSQLLDGLVPSRVYKDWLESLVGNLHDQGRLSGLDLSATVVCLMLPPGAVLVDGTSTGQAHHEAEHGEPTRNPATAEHEEAADSHHGLGGYHGSIVAGSQRILYATGVYSQKIGRKTNGIVAFDRPWKNVVATFYHELVEARTDPDVEDAVRAGNTAAGAKKLGWYSPKYGEIGDVPMEEAGASLDLVMKEVKLKSGKTVPVQLMWSNAVHGPEGPIPKPH